MASVLVMVPVGFASVGEVIVVCCFEESIGFATDSIGFTDLCSIYDKCSGKISRVAGLNFDATTIINTPVTNDNTLSHVVGKPRNRNTMTQTPKIIRNCLFDMWPL